MRVIVISTDIRIYHNFSTIVFDLLDKSRGIESSHREAVILELSPRSGRMSERASYKI